MEHLQVKETSCNYCGQVFSSKGKYQYHFRQVHQNEVKIHHSNQEEIIIRRSENEKFTCICNKSYHVRQSLLHHQRSYQQ